MSTRENKRVNIKRREDVEKKCDSVKEIRDNIKSNIIQEKNEERGNNSTNTSDTEKVNEKNKKSVKLVQ